MDSIPLRTVLCIQVLCCVKAVAEKCDVGRKSWVLGWGGLVQRTGFMLDGCCGYATRATVDECDHIVPAVERSRKSISKRVAGRLGAALGLARGRVAAWGQRSQVHARLGVGTRRS